MDPRDKDYESPRALGHLSRGIKLPPLDALVPILATKGCPSMGDAITTHGPKRLELGRRARPEYACASAEAIEPDRPAQDAVAYNQ